MNHDNVTRTTSLWALSNPGPGVSVRFMCPGCNKACGQLGSKLKRIGGLRQRVCGPCHARLSAPKEPA